MADVNVQWAFTADYVETCNCDYGCPCNFNGFPTNNKCEALVGYHIRQGHYGEVALAASIASMREPGPTRFTKATAPPRCLLPRRRLRRNGRRSRPS